MQNRPSKNFHYGFAAIKMLMCFEVVLCHFWHQADYNVLLTPFRRLTLTAVPVFALISFYLTAPTFLSVAPHVVRKRMMRLCWPQFAWTLIYWIIYLAAGIVHGCDELLWQMFTGHSEVLNATMWYQIVVIMISALFFGIGILTKGKKALAVTTSIGLAALIFQYSGLNHALFSPLRPELYYPLGRFIEMLPYASLGLILSDKNILDRIKKHPRYAVACACVMIALSFIGIIPTPRGFDYPGLNPIIRAFAIIVLVDLIPFDRISMTAKNIIRRISRYTLGIYCMHRLVEKLLHLSGAASLLQRIHISGDSFAFCIVVYIVSYFIAAIIARIPAKLCRQLVE